MMGMAITTRKRVDIARQGILLTTRNFRIKPSTFPPTDRDLNLHPPILE
jgi:hypothetical protein